MDQISPGADPARTPFYDAVFQISRDKGFANVGSRSVAEIAGVAPSFINYRFGSLADLLDEVLVEVDARRVAFWRNAMEDVCELELAPGDFAGLLFAVNRALILSVPGGEDIFWQDVVDTLRTGQRIKTGEAVKTERAYWKSAATRAGMAQDTDVIHAFALGLRFA